MNKDPNKPDESRRATLAARDADSLYDAINNGLFLVDGDLRIVQWNYWMARHSLLPRQQVLGKPLDNVFAGLPESLSRAIDDTLEYRVSSVISNKMLMTPLPLYASRLDREQNNRLQHSLNLVPFGSPDQACCLVQVFDRSPAQRHEISSKRSALEFETLANRSRAQESQLETILNNTLDAIIILNQLGRISDFYRSAQTLFGYSAFELLGKPLSVLFPAPYNRRFKLILDDAQEKDQMLDYQEQVKALRANGEVFFAEVAINTILEKQEKQYIVTIKDTTERQLAEEALYREKEQAQVTLSSIADGVITTDIVGQITFVNPAVLKLTGYRFEDLIHRKLERVITIESERRVFPIYECIEKGVQVDSVAGDMLIDKQGEQLVIHQVASPIHDQAGDIVGAVMIMRDVSKSHRLASRLSWQASHDELTRLVNRREFERRLKSLLETVRQEGSEHCLCLLDLDKFKVVNDTCGHVAGDELLRQLAELFKSRIRGADILARLGGDEFAILLRKCRLDPALGIAEGIRSTVEDYRFGWGEHSFQLGVSIGLMIIDADSPDMDEVFRAADSACYAAKEAGRNRIHVYSPEDEGINLRYGESQWMLRIQNALEQNRFELDYQPIVPLNDASLGVHYEILLRMVDEGGERIPPGAFIPAAERYMMMAKIDRWVIEHLFRWIDDHWTSNATDTFAVNLSGQSLADESLLFRIKKLFSEFGVPPERICFEITETAAISNLTKAQVFIDELKQLGCLFALDDFGSGLSSFAYLKSLPVDYLKIDGAFVKDMVQDPIDRAMVESIHNIGSVLELKTIAEFVEDEYILQQLKMVGVDYAQGYGIARPTPLPRNGELLFRQGDADNSGFS